MEKRCSYGFGRTLEIDFGEAVRKIARALEAGGFTLLFRLDVQAALTKEGNPTGQYIVLGACPPSLSHSAFAADPNVGLMVPCPIAIYEESDRTTVMMLDGSCLMDLLRSPAAITMAMEHREQLENLLETL